MNAIRETHGCTASEGRAPRVLNPIAPLPRGIVELGPPTSPPRFTLRRDEPREARVNAARQREGLPGLGKLRSQWPCLSVVSSSTVFSPSLRGPFWPTPAAPRIVRSPAIRPRWKVSPPPPVRWPSPAGRFGRSAPTHDRLARTLSRFGEPVRWAGAGPGFKPPRPWRSRGGGRHQEGAGRGR